MPDPRRLYRRVTESQLPTRLIAHVSVLALVAAASLAGLGQLQRAGGSASSDTGILSLVQTARGAGEAFIAETTVHEIGEAAPQDESALLDRAARAQAPGTPEPLPTPLAIDPDATPLPGPQEAQPAIGGTTTSSATSRAPAPGPVRTTLVWPVVGGTVTQYYHAGHLALDIAAPYGSQVVAAQGGTVTWAGWRNNGGGYVIVIEDGNGMRTSYNHLGTVWVSPGQIVSAGQGIAGVGCTGMCTGPHVHFEVVVNGVIDNPLRYF